MTLTHLYCKPRTSQKRREAIIACLHRVDIGAEDRGDHVLCKTDKPGAIALVWLFMFSKVFKRIE